MRRLLNPILKLFFNPNTLIHAVNKQIRGKRAVRGAVPISSSQGQQRDEVDVLYYELVHNLVLELTRIGIENRNLKMRLESLSSRMDFDERRARALEGVVQYRPGTGPAREPQQPRPRPDERPAPPPPPASSAPQPVQVQPPQPGTAAEEQAGESNTARRRRRRRRGRRGGRSRTPGEGMAAEGAPTEVASPEDSGTSPHGDPTADAASNDASDADFDDDPARRRRQGRLR